MEVVKPFDVGGVATAILLIDLDLVGKETRSWRQFGWHDDRTVVCAEGLPGFVHLWRGSFSEGIFFEEGTVEAFGMVGDGDVFHDRAIALDVTRASVIKIERVVAA